MSVGSADHTVDGDVEVVLGELAGHLNVTTARLVAVAARVIAGGEWRQHGQRSAASFLAWRMGLSPERARQVVTVAAKRSEFPVLMGAFERGELSLEQVVEAVKAPAWADAQVAEFASISTVTKLRRAMRSNMFEADPDEPTSSQPAPTDRVSFGVTDNGRWRLSADLSIDEGRRIETALSERRDALFSAGEEDVTWAEALVDCFDRSLGAVESPSRRDLYRTWVHLDASNGDATTTDGWRIPQSLERLLLCDGVVQPVWEHDGVPFSVGRSQRIVPHRTRRIVEKRDRGCRVPGCTADRFVEIHHIVHWQDGGTTDTANLLSLCAYHHKLHHQGQLGISGNADTFDGIVFTDARGKPMAGSGVPIPPTAPPPDITPYVAPLAGRFDWNWIGLGWTHPNAQRRRREQLDQHHQRKHAA